MDQALDEYVRAQTAPRPWDGGYHPSGLFGCDRKVVYGLRDTPRPDTWKPGANRALLVGNTLGPVLQTAITEQVGHTLREAYIEPEIDVAVPFIKGHVDALIYCVDETYEVIENKTINEWALKSAMKKGEIPKPDHVNQGLTYLWAIKYHGFYTDPVYDDDWMCPNCNTPWKCNGPHIPEEPEREFHEPIPQLNRLRVVYWEKSYHPVHEYIVNLTPEWEESFIEHIARLDRYKADGTALPLRLPKDSWQCNYCSYQQQCWKIDSEGVDI